MTRDETKQLMDALAKLLEGDFGHWKNFRAGEYSRRNLATQEAKIVEDLRRRIEAHGEVPCE